MSALTVNCLGNTFHESGRVIAFVHGKKHLELSVITRFDGFGNSRVFFRISEGANGEDFIDYEKFDAAATAYNLKIERQRL